MKPRRKFLRTEFLAPAVILVLGAAFVVVYQFILPEYYASTVRVTADRPLAAGLSDRSEAFSGYIRSEAVLVPVITNLQLNAKWAQRYREPASLRTEDTYLMLKRMTKVTLGRGIALVQITVRSEDKQEAASIANEIASSYRVQTLRLGQGRERKPLSVEIVDMAEPGLRPMGRVAGSLFISGSAIIFIEFAGAIVLALLLTRLFVPVPRTA